MFKAVSWRNSATRLDKTWQPPFPCWLFKVVASEDKGLLGPGGKLDVLPYCDTHHFTTLTGPKGSVRQKSCKTLRALT